MQALMVCLGFKPSVAGLKAQTNPLSYGGTPPPESQSYLAFLWVGKGRCVSLLFDHYNSFHLISVQLKKLQQNSLKRQRVSMVW